MSRYDSDDRFDFNRLLDWKKAQVVQGDASGLQPDETYVLQWTVPYGAQEQAREWIYANRQGFYGPELPFMQLNGFWRTAQVRYQVVEPKNSNAGVNILQTIAKGYYTSIDWDAARILSEDSSKSNTSSADGVANTQSAVEQRFLQVRFPFIAPESVSAIVGSVSVPSPVSIRGNTYTGLNKIVEAARLEEDGSYSVLVTLADPQYTLESYSDAGGTNEQDIVYLFNVPKENAQTIIDGWKSTNPVGASASADYNDSQKLVNIVLRRNALVKPNLTLAGINVACDTTQNFHFAWGYEKADIQAFIDAHNDPTEAGSRQVQVQTRSDGLYDITIIETVVTADPPPHFAIVLAVGDKITNTQKYGWNINNSQLNAIKSAYETKVAGESKTFRVTRQDDCTFDYEGSVVAQQKQEAEVSISGQGVTTKAKTIRGATDAATGYTAGPRKRHRVDVRKEDDGTNTISVSEEEVKAGSLTSLSSGAGGISSESGSFSNLDTVPTIPQSGPRVRVQPEIRVNEDGTFTGGYSKTSVKSVGKVNVGGGTGVIDKSSAYLNLDSVPTATQSAKRIRVRHRIQANEDGTFSGGEEVTEVQAVPQTVSPVGGGGVSVESASYANQDAPPKAPTSEKRVRVQSDIRANDDGTFSGGYTKQTVQIGEGNGSITGDGITVKTRAKSNADSVDTIYTANKRERVSLSISPNDDGTVNFVESQQTLQQAGPEEISISGEGITTTVKAAKNLDSPPASFFTAGKRKRHSVSLSANDDGTWDATGSEQEVKTADKEASTGSAGITYNVRAAKNLDLLNLTSNPGKAERLSISASANDDGTFDIVELKQTLKAENQTSNTGSDGIIYDVYVQSNQDFLTLKSNPAKKERVSISASANDDGTFNVVEVKQKVVETNAEESSIDGEGIELRAKAAKNSLSIPDALYTAGPRKRHSLSVTPNDDGTWDAVATEQEVKEVQGQDIEINGNDNLGIRLKATIYKNTEDFEHGVTKKARVRHSISASANDDKTIDYTILETEVQKVNSEFVEIESEDDNYGIRVKSEVYNNADVQDINDIDIKSKARQRHNVSVTANDDGTLNCSIVEEETREIKEAELNIERDKDEEYGIQLKQRVYRGVEREENKFVIPSDFKAEARKQYTSSISTNPDGTADYIIQEIEIPKVENKYIEVKKENVDDDGIQVKNYIYSNIDQNGQGSFPIPEEMFSGPRKRHNASISANQDGTLNYTIQEIEVQKTESEIVIDREDGKAEGIKVKQNLYKGVEKNKEGGYPLPENIFAKPRVRHNSSFTINDDGTADYIIQETELSKVENKKIEIKREDSSDYGVQTASIVYNNVELNDEGKIPVPEGYYAKPRIRNNISISANDDGTFNYLISESESVEVKDAKFSIENNDANISGGIKLRQWVYSNVEREDDGTYKLPQNLEAEYRKRHTANISVNDDGTSNYIVQESEVAEVKEKSIEVGNSPLSEENFGVRVKAVAYKNITPNDNNTLPIPEGMRAKGRQRHSFNISGNDDGTVDYTIIETEVKETKQNTIVGDASKSKKIYYAENIQQEDELEIPGIITNQVINVKDDGTIGYVAVTKNVENPTLMEHTYESAGSTVDFNAQVGGKVDDLPSLNGNGEAEECDIVLRPDEDGSGSWTAVKTTWKGFDLSAKAGSQLFKEVVDIGQNKKISEAKEALNGEAVSGELIRVSAQIDEKSGKVTYVKSTTTAQEEQWTDEEDDNFIKKTITRKRNAQKAEKLSGSTGRTQSQLNEYQKYDTIKEVLSVSENLKDFTESRTYQKNERRWVFIQRDFSGSAPSWKELPDGEIRKKNTSRTFTAFGVVYYKRQIDVTETIQYSVNPLNSGSSASAPDEGEKEVSVQILPNGLFVKRTTTITINEWDKDPTIFEDVTFKGATGTEVESELLDNGTTKLKFLETNSLSGSV